MLLKEPEEVRVLADEHSTGFARGHENLAVGRIPQMKIANSSALNGKTRSDPGGQRGRELRVQPELHAATIG